MPFDGNATSFQIVTELEQMREVLKKGWTQNALAKDDDGCAVFVTSPHATRFCLIGAWRKVVGLGSNPLAASTLIFLEKRLGMSVADWNDDPRRTRHSVLCTLSRCIRAARAL